MSAQCPDYPNTPGRFIFEYTSSVAPLKDDATPALAGLSLIFVAQAVEALLHLVHLAFEFVDLVAAARLRIAFIGFSRGLSLAARERREHGKRAFEHFHVPPHLVLERAERAAAEGLRHMLAEFFLLAGERVDGDFEIARHQHLHAVAIEADELTQESDGQEALPLLVLLLEDDLRQDLTGDVLAGLGVVNDEILARLHHGREVFERDVGTGAGVVEPSVRAYPLGSIPCFF